MLCFCIWKESKNKLLQMRVRIEVAKVMMMVVRNNNRLLIIGEPFMMSCGERLSISGEN